MAKPAPHWTTDLPTESGFYFWRDHKPLPGEAFVLGRTVDGDLTRGVVRVEIDPKGEWDSTATIGYWTDFLEELGGEYWSERMDWPPG